MQKIFKKSLTLFTCSPLAFLAIPLSSRNDNLKVDDEMSTKFNINADLDTISHITDGSPRGNSFQDLKDGKIGSKLSPRQLPNGEFKSYEIEGGATQPSEDELYNNPIDRSGIRFGGGLIFDLPYEKIPPTELKNQIKDGETFATHGFVSSNTPEIRHPELGDLVAEETINEESSDGKYFKKGHLDFPEQLSITPNNGPDNTPTMQKKAFLELFNLELFVWYWNNWNTQFYAGDPTTANENLAASKVLETDFFDKSLIVNRPEINLSISWNQVKEVNISGGEKLGRSIGNAFVSGLIGSAVALANPLAGALLGGLSSVGLDFLTTDTEPQNTKNIGDYYSQYLDEFFWKSYFDKYLGTPDQPTNKIWEFYKKYDYFPSQIKMEDFDIELSNIELKSDYSINQEIAPLTGLTWSGYESNSIIDLSNLEIGLNTDITLQRESPDIHKMLEKLNGDTIGIYSSDIGSMDSADEQTATAIRKAISMNVPELGNFRNGLTFTNQLVANESVPINVFYNGIPQNIDFKIHLKT